MSSTVELFSESRNDWDRPLQTDLGVDSPVSVASRASSGESSDIAPSKPFHQLRSQTTPNFPGDIFSGAFDVPTSTPVRPNRYTSPVLRRIMSPLPNLKDSHKPSCEEMVRSPAQFSDKCSIEMNLSSCRVESCEETANVKSSTTTTEAPPLRIPVETMTKASSSYPPQSSIVELPPISKRDAHWSTFDRTTAVPPSPGTAARLTGYKSASRSGGLSLKPKIAPIAMAASPHVIMQPQKHDYNPPVMDTSISRIPQPKNQYDRRQMWKGESFPGPHPFAPSLLRPPTKEETASYHYQNGRGPTSAYDYHQHSTQIPMAPPPSSKDGALNFGMMTSDERNYHKACLMDMIKLLHYTHPEYKIPFPSDDCSVELVFEMYKTFNRKISAAKEAVQYRIILIVLFIVMEFFFTYCGIDFSGFAEKQIRLISRYQSTLNELAEKFASKGGGVQLSVEMRLAFLVGFQSIVFAIIKASEKFFQNSGFSNVIESTIYGVVDLSADMLNSEEKVDMYGMPIIAGTEDDLNKIYSKNSAMSSGTTQPTMSTQPPTTASSSQPPPMDISGMLMKCLTNGGGGMDLPSMIGTAMKMFAPDNKPDASKASTNPKIPEPTTSPESIRSKQSPVLSSPPRSSRPRKLQFSE